MRLQQRQVLVAHPIVQADDLDLGRKRLDQPRQRRRQHRQPLPHGRGLVVDDVVDTRPAALERLLASLPDARELTLDERRARLEESAAHLTSESLHPFTTGGLAPEAADHMIENAVATIAIPVGVATNMKVDGRDVLVPMATLAAVGVIS